LYCSIAGSLAVFPNSTWQ